MGYGELYGYGWGLLAGGGWVSRLYMYMPPYMSGCGALCSVSVFWSGLGDGRLAFIICRTIVAAYIYADADA